MTQFDIISLEEAKLFLVVDYPDKDEEIKIHIKTAIGVVERYTNHMMWQRAKTYTITGCSLEIYDYPLTVSTTVSRVHKNVLSTTYYNTEGTELSAIVGYASKDAVPSELIDAAKKIITYLFENKDISEANLPWDIQILINSFRRSATI